MSTGDPRSAGVKRAEAILYEMEAWRENQELREMNGRKCGAKQANRLSFYRRRQQSFADKTPKSDLHTAPGVDR